MSLIVDIEFATYEIASFGALMWYMYRIKKMRDVENNKQLQRDIQYAVDKAIDDRITKIVQQVINSDGFENKMKDTVISALNQSQQMRMLDQIVLVLCTYVPELKKSKLCNP